MLVRTFAIAVALLMATVSPVDAQSAQPAPVQQDLSDILSPDELLQEFGIDAETLRQNMLWFSAGEQPRLQIIVNKAVQGTAPGAQTLEAYVDGTLAYRFPVSTGIEIPIVTPSGSHSSRRTPVGTFRIYLRSRNHVSRTWDGARMPFAQFFNGGIAIHATTPNHYAALGRRDSGGCVRLHPTNARIMWDLVGTIGMEDTIVIVYDGRRESHPLGQNAAPQEQAPVITQPVPDNKDNGEIRHEEIERLERERTQELNRRQLEEVRRMQRRMT